MRLETMVWWLTGIVTLALPTFGQTPSAVRSSSGLDQPPRFELSLGYNYLRANAPPGSCQCFSLNGGFASLDVNVAQGLSVVAAGSAGFAGHVVGTQQSISVVNYLFGPRYYWRRDANRFTPFGQALLGGSTELSNVTPVQHVSSFAFSLGGGLNARLTHRLGWNVPEVDWVHSQLPNGSSNRQNDLKIASGIVIRF